MEKYYCVNCMLLLNNNDVCKRCGNHDINKIEINVQTQKLKIQDFKNKPDS
ncbi:hypothetical protein [Bacillus sp. UMB0893]|uniref:hypothetical protein n=1 Tax=Bacillus sp. UMB0893 TaxID=2066053 RepID=UPI0015DF5BFA|nr:hypothetical protein [Bacillus sp. UMB0893]QNG58661.1 hypothetical protein H4O14_12535 [Bacillus sp. PAMC26568]